MTLVAPRAKERVGSKRTGSINISTNTSYNSGSSSSKATPPPGNILTVSAPLTRILKAPDIKKKSKRKEKKGKRRSLT
jgi:hypothetical protein